MYYTHFTHLTCSSPNWIQDGHTMFQANKTRQASLPEEHVTAIRTSAIFAAFFQFGPANRSPNWHFIWTPVIFCSCTTNLQWITAWAQTVQYNTSVFQVSPEATPLPPSHGQFSTSLSSCTSDCVFYDEVCNWYWYVVDMAMALWKLMGQEYWSLLIVCIW